MAKLFYNNAKGSNERHSKRDTARQDVFNYIKMFYNPTQKHTNNDMLSPVDYEMKQQKINEADV